MKVLIIGKIPPPIGGVTIHVQRLIEHLKNDKLNYKILNYSNLSNFIFLFSKYNIAHIHVSNKKLRLVLLLILKLLNKKAIVTYHGNYSFENIFDRISLKMSTVNFLLNKSTFTNSGTISKNNILIGAFIPPININNSLSDQLVFEIENFTKQYLNVYCTNASDLVYDSRGYEIYQGSEIIEFFKNHQEIGLIFSDPSGKHKEKYLGYSDNILFIDSSHQFVDIFRFANFMIRFTTTDGDSLSVKEALYYNLKVFASNCVERPEGVKIIDKIEEILDLSFETKVSIPENNYFKILNTYKSL